MTDLVFKSWTDVTDLRLATHKHKKQVEDLYQTIRFSHILIPASIQADIKAGLKAPHLTEQGVENMLESLRSLS
jgi:hypothetical protein